MGDVNSFEAFFADAAGGRQAYPYQVQLAREPWPETLVIPTGFGKTAAVLAAWLWKLSRRTGGAPLRLVYCLPMRTLVEQTAAVARDWLAAADRCFGWSEAERPLLQVAMGGQSRPRGAPPWVLQPDRPALIIGTQDMLVSAALMRGYGISRFRWPVDFALLHRDALWVFDEVQLAGATLPTSAQLQGWRNGSRLAPQTGVAPSAPARTLWMSATFDPAWLQTVDFTPRDPPRATDLTAQDLSLDHPAKLWRAGKRVSPGPKPAALKSAKDQQAYARMLAELVRPRVRPDATVLVFVNTVARAQALYGALVRAGVAEVVLIHSRFRPQERKAATSAATATPKPRVIVATQALEAGVDLSSSVLISELAPWSSMVQRFGRCNRYGECGDDGAELLWIDLPAGAEQPYDAEALDEARAKLRGLSDANPEALSRIAPGEVRPCAVIRQGDLLGLFDTEPDLSGFDVDVSVYVRDAQDLDVHLFWRDVPAHGEPDGVQAEAPTPDELCPASIAAVRTLMKRGGVRVWRADRLPRGKTVWVRFAAAELRPGQELMVASDGGGYDPELGLVAESAVPVQPVGEGDRSPLVILDDDQDADIGTAVRLADHSRHVRDEMERLCEALGVDGGVRERLVEAALWHDRGKAHAAFQQMLSADWRCGDELFAKSRRPKAARQEPQDRRTSDPDLRRPRFRHELASTLSFLEEKGWAREADLGAYLIAAHHGKVRMRLRALPDEKRPGDGRLFARGVWDGDQLPATALGEAVALAATLDLDIMQLGEGRRGASWSTRTQALLDRHGPFELAWLESLVRIADWRASRAEQYAAEHGLDPDTPWSRDMSQDEAG